MSGSERRRAAAGQLVPAACGGALLVFAWVADREWFRLHLTPAYCARYPGEMEGWARWRWGAVAVAALLLVVVRPLLGRWARRRSAGEAIAAASRMLLAGALALVVCDVALRRGHPAPPLFPIPIGPSFPPIHPDARLGWAHDRKKTTTIPTSGRDIRYAIDGRGYRARTEDDPDPTRPTILFAGESFAEGIAVQWEEAYPALVGEHLHVDVATSAVWGYAPDQAYRAMKDELAWLQHPLAVVTLLMPEVLARTRSENRSWLGLEGDTLVTRPPDRAPDWWRASPLRKLGTTLFPYHDDSAVDIVRAIIQATASEVRARGALPLFLFTNWEPPCIRDEHGRCALEERLFGGLDVAWTRVDLDPAAVDELTRHPTPASHLLLARGVERALGDSLGLGR